MTPLPLTEPVALEVPSLPRAALDELYHFLQYLLQLKYKVDLELALEGLEDAIDGFDADVALQETGNISLADLKQELNLECAIRGLPHHLQY
jgi:hypothetical protein